MKKFFIYAFCLLFVLTISVSIYRLTKKEVVEEVNGKVKEETLMEISEEDKQKIEEIEKIQKIVKKKKLIEEKTLDINCKHQEVIEIIKIDGNINYYPQVLSCPKCGGREIIGYVNKYNVH